MRIVVTGALGHIGSRLIHELPAAFEGAEIVLLDNLSTQRYCSLFNLPPYGHYRFIEADLVPIFAGASVVIHLAALTNPSESFEIEDQIERVNLVGTQRVAQACIATRSNLVFPSTTSVYGPRTEIVDEECSVEDLRPQSPYAASKLRAEEYLQLRGDSDGLRFIICRFGTIFGTSIGMRFHTAVNKFCWQAINGLPLTVWRTAMDQKRSYLELGDATSAIKFILQEDVFDRRVYNVLTTNASVRQIVESIAKYEPDTKVQHVDTAIMNQLSYHVRNDRFRQLGFEFKGDLEQGIGETLSLLRGIRPFPMAKAAITAETKQ
jgi:UDP-glucose 4-epimerase